MGPSCFCAAATGRWSCFTQFFVPRPSTFPLHLHDRMCVSLVLCDKSELETSAQFDTVPTLWGLSLHLNNSSRSSKQLATGRDPEPVQNISYWIITGNQICTSRNWRFNAKTRTQTAHSSGPVTLLHFIHYFHTVCLSDRQTQPFSRNLFLLCLKLFSLIQSILIFSNSHLNIITRI